VTECLGAETTSGIGEEGIVLSPSRSSGIGTFYPRTNASQAFESWPTSSESKPPGRGPPAVHRHSDRTNHAYGGSFALIERDYLRCTPVPRYRVHDAQAANSRRRLRSSPGALRPIVFGIEVSPQTAPIPRNTKLDQFVDGWMPPSHAVLKIPTRRFQRPDELRVSLGEAR